MKPTTRRAHRFKHGVYPLVVLLVLLWALPSWAVLESLDGIINDGYFFAPLRDRPDDYKTRAWINKPWLESYYWNNKNVVLVARQDVHPPDKWVVHCDGDNPIPEGSCPYMFGEHTPEFGVVNSKYLFLNAAGSIGRWTILTENVFTSNNTIGTQTWCGFQRVNFNSPSVVYPATAPQGSQPGQNDNTFFGAIIENDGGNRYVHLTGWANNTCGNARVQLPAGTWTFSPKTYTFVSPNDQTHYVFLFKQNEMNALQQKIYRVTATNLGQTTLTYTTTESAPIAIGPPHFVTGHNTDKMYVSAPDYMNGGHAIVRINLPDMTIDTSFGTNGYVSTEGPATNIVIKNNKITAFMEDYGITRFNMDGSRDTTFGGADGHLDYPHWLGTVLDDGRIAIVNDFKYDGLQIFNNGLTEAPTATINCPEVYYTGARIACDITLKTPGTTEPMKVDWTVESNNAVVERNHGLSATIRPTGNGPITVKARVSPARYSNSGMYWDFVSNPIPQGITIAVTKMTCPEKVYIGGTYTCSVNAVGTINGYEWLVNKSEITNGQNTQTATFTAGQAGGVETVTVNVNGTAQESVALRMGNDENMFSEPTSVGNEPSSVRYHRVFFSSNNTNGWTVPQPGWINKIKYSFNLNSSDISKMIVPSSFRFVLVAEDQGEYRVVWMSDTITTSEEDRGQVREYTLPHPVYVKPTYRLGLYLPYQSPGKAMAGPCYRAGLMGLLTDAGLNKSLVGQKLTGIMPGWSNSVPGIAAYGTSTLGDTTKAVATADVNIVVPSAPQISIVGEKYVAERKTVRYTASTNAAQTGDQLVIEWQVNGESVATGEYVDVSFPAKGLYTITAKAYPVGFPQKSAEASLRVSAVTVSAPKLHVIAPKAAEVGDTITLKAEIARLLGGLTPVVNWSFPDGSTATGTEVTYVPKVSDKGAMIVSATLYPEGYDDLAVTASAKVNVTHYIFPVFTATPKHKVASAPVPFQVEYVLTPNVKSKCNLTYTWDFGDGSPVVSGKKNSMKHTYTVPGEYTITATVTDDRNNSQTIQIPVVAGDQAPFTVDFKYSGLNKYHKVPLNLRVRPDIKGGNLKKDRIATYEWYINNELVSQKETLVATLEEPGTYTLALKATTGLGFEALAQTTLEVFPNQLPSCEISYKDYPDRRQPATQLIATCSDPDGKIKSYSWDFGNGETSDKQKPYTNYSSSGTYTVTLTVTDDNGESATFQQAISVRR